MTVRTVRQLHTSCGWLRASWCGRPHTQPIKANRNMRSFWSLSLQRQLAIAIGLLLVPLLVAAAWSGMSTYRERASELGDQARVIAYTTAAYVDHDLTNIDATGNSIIVNPDVRALDPRASADLFHRLVMGHT